MGRFIDLTDQKFNRLEVKSVAYKTAPGMYFWRCVCDCGNEAIVAGMHLRSGNTKSCGCRKLETMLELPASTFKDGRCVDPALQRLYYRYNGMHNRCEDPTQRNFHRYGGRGIKVCKRWSGERGFANFFKDVGLPPPGMSIDRIDNDGDYKPSNVRWATPKQQANNRRGLHFIEYGGRRLTVTNWAALLNKRSQWLSGRLRQFTLAVAMAPFDAILEGVAT